MPADYRLWLDDHQYLLPARPEPAKRDPEGAIEAAEPRLGSRLSVDGELLA
jgi:hypothetical protein